MPESDFLRLTDDRHQQALYRLAAVGQYLYDTMNGDAESDRPTPDPLPEMSMEKVREAQALIDMAIKHGQRTRRSCLGGELRLLERAPRPMPKHRRVRFGRLQVSWVGRHGRLAVRRRRLGGIEMCVGLGSLYLVPVASSQDHNTTPEEGTS